MYVVTSIPLVSRTRATLRSAEFGFFGVVVYTRVHTPRRCGLPFSAAVLVFASLSSRPLRTSCWMVGMDQLSSFGACCGHVVVRQVSTSGTDGASWPVPPYPAVGRVAVSPAA